MKISPDVQGKHSTTVDTISGVQCVPAVLRTRLLLAADSTSFIYLDWVCPPELGHVELGLSAKELDVHHVAVVGPRAILQGAVLLAPKVPGVNPVERNGISLSLKKTTYLRSASWQTASRCVSGMRRILPLG